jgi:GT2 family glycosyltransferase/peptidoglycan/xylan/chitin deacetylase (PgdA/CDA1 family)
VAAPRLICRVRFSLVIPTYQRHDLVVRLIEALERQGYCDFEAIVVIDGSSDHTASALRRISTRFPFTVVEQAHRGVAVARNSGAATAQGELLLFLDDDMVPDPAMIHEHDRSHRAGADLVFGDMPLHPDSPRTAMAAVTGRWAERRRARLSLPGSEVRVPDLLTGQMSIWRSAFERLGGFDTAFTRDGLAPGADRDFGYRARKAGLRIVFNPAAVSYQHYEVDAADYTRRSRYGARGDQVLRETYPEIADELPQPRFDTRRSRLILGSLAIAPSLISWPIRVLAVRLFSRARPGPRSHRLFFAVQTMERIRGAHEAERALRSPLAVVIAYHAVADLHDDRVLAEYGVPPERFAAQLDALARYGWRFVTLEAILDALDGRGTLPARALLVTFDDAYADLRTAACPMLVARRVPAVAFAVSDLIGGTNEWSKRGGASRLPLLDEGGLLELASNSVTVGSHGATHMPLVGLTVSQLEYELRGSAETLRAIGLPRPVAFSYPHGEWNADVAAEVRKANYAAAFTVTSGVIRRSSDRWALPRVEVYAGDTPIKLGIKLATAGWPDPWRRRLLRLARVKVRP